MVNENNNKPIKSPKGDLEALDANLQNAQLCHTQAAEELGFQRSIVKAITPVWGEIVLSQDSPPVVTSGAAFISEWRQQSQTWYDQSKYQYGNINVASSTASTVAYNTISMQKICYPEPRFDPTQITYILQQRDEKAFVEDGLRVIDNALANEYRTAWQYINLPALDPVRGPLFLMRQVFDHLLDKLAPDTEVTSQSDFVPNNELLKRNGKGITRSHRIQFVANTKIRDLPRRKLVLDSTQNFLDIYKELNKAHKRDPLDEDAAKNVIFAASKLIAEWLQSLELKF